MQTNTRNTCMSQAHVPLKEVPSEKDLPIGRCGGSDWQRACCTWEMPRKFTQFDLDPGTGGSSLSLRLPTCLATFLSSISIHSSIYLPIYLSTYRPSPSTCLSFFVSISLLIDLFPGTHLSIYSATYPSIYVYNYVRICYVSSYLYTHLFVPFISLSI